jgi:hypothetical protein
VWLGASRGICTNQANRQILETSTKESITIYYSNKDALHNIWLGTSSSYSYARVTRSIHTV